MKPHEAWIKFDLENRSTWPIDGNFYEIIATCCIRHQTSIYRTIVRVSIPSIDDGRGYPIYFLSYGPTGTIYHHNVTYYKLSEFTSPEGMDYETL
jgi:hypothetical protein